MNIRNFCIIAHIDHGKSTLADRFLELTNTVSQREMKEQMLDSMDLERERGITIKLTPVRMDYTYNSEPHILNLIDTPGHVDFNYEVSRSLAAVEGAVLLVDAAQGVQAQTIGNLYLAMEQNLAIIPVINKIDLAGARIAETKKEMVALLGCAEEEILLVSAKTGAGVPELLQKIVEKVPPPSIHNSTSTKVERDSFAPTFASGLGMTALRALIFDSVYDDYRGVVAYARLFGGQVKKGDKIFFLATQKGSEVIEVGYFKPKYSPSEKLSAGEIGYIVTGLKNIEGCRVGDTITNDIASETKQSREKNGRDRFAGARDVAALPGYKEVKPMVFAGIFCQQGNDFEHLREAILKLKLNDAALTFEAEHSPALGFGFRCGFLGLLHLDIFRERLEREYRLKIIATVPSVAYLVTKTKGDRIVIKSPQDLPDPSQIKIIEEPWVRADIVSPKKYIGQIIQLVEEKHGLYKNTEYLEAERAILHYELPLAAILVDFYDRLKSVSAGYASLNYEISSYRQADIIKLSILVAEEEAEALASLIYRAEAYQAGRSIVQKLKESLPRQMFEIKIQAAVGGKIIAAERIPAMRKDVLAKMSGGDWTRKMKLLQKQKKGKKKMLARGRVEIPSETYLAILKR
ncbi:MAG: elongation factor 4 [Candidatus Magasanikbacteria bacterium]|nr:elongation factor 4 [Candidatus Magasanikbacteria bacterium]